MLGPTNAKSWFIGKDSDAGKDWRQKEKEVAEDETLSITDSMDINFFFKEDFQVFCLFFYFNWRIFTLQYCGGFCHTFTWISHGCTRVPHPDPQSPLLPHPIPQGHPSAPALNTPSHAWNLGWWSISQMIIYMFQCYSLKSSHPHLLPQNLTVCSLSVSLLLSCI